MTGKPYRGVNVFLLQCSAYGSNAWLTYKQAQDMGAQVRKGEKSSPIVFWKFPTRAGADAGEGADGGEVVEAGEDRARGPLMRLYHVFNIEQVDGLTPELPFDAPFFEPIAEAERIVSGYMGSGNHPSLSHGGDRAFYRPITDSVRMPEPGTFDTPAHYYSTLFHEFAHSTGHAGRLARKSIVDGSYFGDRDYSEEELCAEFTAAFLAGECGISNDALLENSTAYIQNWIQKLTHEPKIAVYAAQRAQKAADYILGRSGAVAPSGVAA
jgi:antirestriction protein ArdC